MTQTHKATCAHCGSDEIAMIGAVAHYSSKRGEWIVETFLGAPTIECHQCNQPSNAPTYVQGEA